MPHSDRNKLHATFWAAPDSALFDRAHVAAGLMHCTAWLKEQEYEGDGPPSLRLGGKYLFRKADVLAWIARKENAVTEATQ